MQATPKNNETLQQTSVDENAVISSKFGQPRTSRNVEIVNGMQEVNNLKSLTERPSTMARPFHVNNDVSDFFKLMSDETAPDSRTRDNPAGRLHFWIGHFKNVAEFQLPVSNGVGGNGVFRGLNASGVCRSPLS